MKYRVKPGASWKGARAGEIVEAGEHQAAIVPWCLEAVADEPSPVASEQPAKETPLPAVEKAPDEKPAKKSRGK